ncbi:MAG: relaxase/mobilization nuclease domain-containing protein, partial [Acidobacteriaceae bacterium]|nr:relaxase/mobilization nuclease domain-containing protein [Acidobacteriaceae bacterium]
MDLVRLTRDLMNRVEADLGIPLDWVAVAHFNTDNPHVHVALRGVGPDQQQVRLSREYVKSGIRTAAEDLCTRELGHRTDLDAVAAERHEISGKRFTSLDRALVRTAGRVANEPFLSVEISTARRQAGEDDLAWTRRQHLIARLRFLEDMGLARSLSSGTWNLRPDVEGVLRAMQRTGDRQKVLAAHGVLLSD